MSSTTTFKCLNCNETLRPDARNRGRQCYCGKPACHQASKAASQARWTAKPENHDYFRGNENSERTRQWRLANPGYWRRKGAPRPARPIALQETLKPQAAEIQPLEQSCERSALQDDMLLQPALMVGLVSIMTGLASQDAIAATVRVYINRGLDILGMTPGCPQFHHHEKQTTPESRTPAPRAPPI
jgi:hypothetical protein